MVTRHDRINLVPFVSVDHMMKTVLAVGIERFLAELTDYIEQDFAAGSCSTRPRASPRIPARG